MDVEDVVRTFVSFVFKTQVYSNDEDRRVTNVYVTIIIQGGW